MSSCFYSSDNQLVGMSNAIIVLQGLQLLVTTGRSLKLSHPGFNCGTVALVSEIYAIITQRSMSFDRTSISQNLRYCSTYIRPEVVRGVSANLTRRAF